MIKFLEQFFQALRPVFSRNATYNWFIIAFIGFLLRYDTYGVSSIIRALSLCPKSYPCLIHFFHSTAWNIELFMRHWWRWIFSQNVAYSINNRIVFTGDHTKNVKDGRKIPDVQTLHQDSETGSKPSYFRGHHWGCIGLLVHAGKKFFSIPLWTEIHCEALEEKRSTRIVTMAIAICQCIDKNAYVVLDAFFAVSPVFNAVNQLNDKCVHVVTRAKKNIVAYMSPPKKEKGKRGPNRIYGEKLSLMKLFDSEKFKFKTTNTLVYNKYESVRYLVLDLLWRPVKTKVRFILVESSHGRIILMTSDLNLDAKDAIFLYCKRASIETLFDSLKNLLGGFKYHFWSKYLDKSSRKPNKNKNKVHSSNPEKTKMTRKAIEKFILIQMTIIGMLQLIAIKFSKQVHKTSLCWLRTPAGKIPSEFVTKNALANCIRNNLGGFAKNMIIRIIQNKKIIHWDYAQLDEAA